MAVPERDIVDNALRKAAEAVDRIADGMSPESLAATQSEVLTACTTALVHQIRDADDTVATMLVPKLEAGLADLGVILGAARSE